MHGRSYLRIYLITSSNHTNAPEGLQLQTRIKATKDVINYTT